MLELSVQERKFIYSWISSLLSKELTQEQIEHYQQGDFDSLFAFLKELGFSVQIERITAALQPMEFLQLELAADFAHSFLLEGRLSAIPYMSAYLQGEELENALASVDQWMAHYRLRVNRSQNEPSDHLSVLSAILVRLIEDQEFEVQQAFVKRVLLNWLPDFSAKIQTIPLKTPFYPSVVALLYDMLQKDFL